MLFRSVSLDKLVKDYKQASVSGDDFHEVPSAVFKGEERLFGHPMTCNWAISHHETI